MIFLSLPHEIRFSRPSLFRFAKQVIHTTAVVNSIQRKEKGKRIPFDEHWGTKVIVYDWRLSVVIMVSMRAAIFLFIVAWFPLCGMAYSIIKGEMDELTAHQWHLQRIRTMSAFVITLAGWRLFSRLKEEFTEEARLLAVVEGQRLYIAPAKGDERCPCATIDEFTSVQLQDTQSYDQLRFQSNLTTYGVGCAKHDAGITQSCLQDCDDCDLRWYVFGLSRTFKPVNFRKNTVQLTIPLTGAIEPGAGYQLTTVNF